MLRLVDGAREQKDSIHCRLLQHPLIDWIASSAPVHSIGLIAPAAARQRWCGGSLSVPASVHVRRPPSTPCADVPMCVRWPYGRIHPTHFGDVGTPVLVLSAVVRHSAWRSVSDIEPMNADYYPIRPVRKAPVRRPVILVP